MIPCPWMTGSPHNHASQQQTETHVATAMFKQHSQLSHVIPKSDIGFATSVFSTLAFGECSHVCKEYDQHEKANYGTNNDRYKPSFLLSICVAQPLWSGERKATAVCHLHIRMLYTYTQSVCLCDVLSVGWNEVFRGSLLLSVCNHLLRCVLMTSMMTWA